MDSPARDTLDRLLQKVKPVNLTRLLSDLFTCEKRMIFPTIVQLAELYGGFWTFKLEVLREWGEKLYSLIMALPSVIPAIRDWLLQVVPNRSQQDEDMHEEAGFESLKEVFSGMNISTDGWTKPLLIIAGLVATLGMIIGGGCVMSLTSVGQGIAKFATTLGQVMKNSEFIVSGFGNFFGTVLSGISMVFGVKLMPDSPREILIKKIIEKTTEIQAFHTRCTTDMASVIADPQLFENIKRDIADINTIYTDLARSRENLGNLRSLLEELNRVFKELIDYRDKLLAAIVGKQQPTVLWLFGKTGVGKSYFVKYLIDILAKLEERPSLTVYTRSGADQYWSGYMGQDIVVYDDFSAVQNSCDHQELIDIYTPASYLLNMASLEDKGKRFTSRYVIICSNFSHIRASAVLNDPCILDRRRDVLVELMDEEALRLREISGVNTPEDHFKSDWSHATFLECANFTDKDGAVSVLGQRRPVEIARRMFEFQTDRKKLFMDALGKAQETFDCTLPTEALGPQYNLSRRPVVAQTSRGKKRGTGDNSSEGSYGTRVDNWAAGLAGADWDDVPVSGAAFQAALPLTVVAPLPQGCIDRLARLNTPQVLSDVEHERRLKVQIERLKSRSEVDKVINDNFGQDLNLPPPLTDDVDVVRRTERKKHLKPYTAEQERIRERAQTLIKRKREIEARERELKKAEPGLFGAIFKGITDGFREGYDLEMKEEAFGDEITESNKHRVPIVLLTGAPGTGKTEILNHIAELRCSKVQCEGFNLERTLVIDEIGLNRNHFEDCRQLVMNVYDGRSDVDLIVLSGNPSTFERMFTDEEQRGAFYRRISEIFYFSFKQKYWLGGLRYGPSDIATKGFEAVVEIQQKSTGFALPALSVENLILGYKALHESYVVHRALMELPINEFTQHIVVSKTSAKFFEFCTTDTKLQILLPQMWNMITIKKGTISDIYKHVYAIFGRISSAQVKVRENLDMAFCFLNNMQIPSPCNGILLVEFKDCSYGIVARLGEPVIITRRGDVKFMRSSHEVRKVQTDGSFEVTGNPVVVAAIDKYHTALGNDINNLVGLGIQEHVLALRDMPFFGPYFEIIDGFAELLKIGVGAYSIYEICRSAHRNGKLNRMHPEGYVSDAEDDDDHCNSRRTNDIRQMRKTARSNREVKAYIDTYDQNLHRMVRTPVHYGDSEDEEAPKKRFSDTYNSEDVKSRTNTDPTVSYESSEIPYHGHKTPLSNFYARTLVVDGVEFPTAEHAYQYKHAQVLGDEKRAVRIMEATSGAAAKAVGSELKATFCDEWNKTKRDHMIHIMRSKFQDPVMRDSLLRTGEALLSHDVPDRYWGSLNYGHNNHGKILMDIRAELTPEVAGGPVYDGPEPKKTPKTIYKFPKARRPVQIPRNEVAGGPVYDGPEPKKTPKTIYKFPKARRPVQLPRNEFSDTDYGWDEKRLKKHKTPASKERGLEGVYSHEGVEFAHAADLPLVDEAMTDNQARAVVEMLPRNTVYILKEDQMMCRGLMIYGRVGVTVEHVLELREGETFRVQTVDGVYTATILEMNRSYDLMWFVIEDKSRQFTDIRKHLISKVKDVHDLTGYDAILATVSLGETKSIFARAVQMAAVKTTVIAKKQKYGISYSGTCTSYEYQPILTKNGDCGSPLIMINSTRLRKIVSIHNAANVTTGFGSLLFVEDVPDYREEAVEFKNDITVLPHQGIRVAELPDWKLFKGFGVCELDGEIVNNFSNGKTRIWDSPLAFPEKFGETHEPAVLSMADPRMTEGACPLEDAMDKWSHEQPEVDREAWDEAVDHVADQVAQAVLQTCGNVMKVLTKTESINRYARIATSNPIYRMTSSGYPFKHWKGVVKKEVFFEQIESGGVMIYSIAKTNEQGRLLNDAVDRLIDAARRGERSAVVFSGTLKDEVLKKKKIYEKTATRSFAGSPLDYTIAHRMYLHTAVAGIAQARGILAVKVGIDAHSCEWDELFYYLTEFSDMGFDLDYSMWDATVPKFAMESLPVIYNRIYQLCDPNHKEEDDVIRTALHSVLHGPLVTYYDSVVQLPGGQVSGQPATAIDNCLVNMVYMCYYWRKLAQVHSPKHQSFIKMDTLIRYAVYGDDNICMVAQEVQSWFNLSNVMAEAAKLGLHVTNAAKDANVVDIQPIWNLGFLKRGFAKVELKGAKTKFVCGPLDTVSLGKCLAYTTINREHNYWEDKGVINFDLITIDSTVRSVMEEACLHGEKFYREMRNHCLQKLRNVGSTLTIPPYFEQLKATYFK